MLTLNQIFRVSSHIVTQIIETEFIVRTKGNISQISFTTGIGVRLMLIDTINTQSVELVQRSHPLGVTFRQVIVHGNHMHTVSGQRIQEYRQGSHQRFTFTGCHFGNFTFMKYHTTKQLYIIVYHVPSGIVTSGHPMVLINRFIAFYTDKIFRCSQLTVEIGSGYYYFLVFSKAACRIFYNGKSYRQHFIQRLFIFLQYFFFQFINLSKKLFPVFHLRFFYKSLQFFNFRFFFRSRLLDILLQL